MKNRSNDFFFIYTAEKIGLGAFVLAFLAAIIDIRLAALPLAGYIVICLTAPFFPRVSFFQPVVSRAVPGTKGVALTFDDGPDPLTTPALLDLLSQYGVSATFFIAGEKAAAHPDLIREILARGHAIGNHTYSHGFLKLVRGGKHLWEEIRKTQEILHNLGITAYVFRPPAGIVTPHLRGILGELGLCLVNFSCRSFDGGNRRIGNLSKRIMKKVGPGDIVLLHDVRPHKEELVPVWIDEIDRLIAGLKERGLEVIPLSEAIDRPVMATSAKSL